MTPRFFKRGSFKGVLACQRQIPKQSAAITERSCLEQMLCDLPGALVAETRIHPLDRVRDCRVHLFFVRTRDAGQQRLTHEFMGEGERLLGSLGAGDDYSHLLRFLDGGEEFVNLDLADLSQEPKAESAPDHRGGCQHA